MAAAACRPLMLSGVLKGGVAASRVTSKQDQFLPKVSILQGRKTFGLTPGRISPVPRNEELIVTARMSCGPKMQRKDEKEEKRDEEAEEYAGLLLKMGALDDPLKWLMVGLGLAALSWPEPAFAAPSPGDLDNQVLRDLIDNIRWGPGFMIAGPVITFGVQFLKGTNTAGLIVERRDRDFQVRILSVPNTISLAETGRVELATVMARTLAQDVVKERLKTLAVELMKDEAVSAVPQKKLEEWLKPNFDSIDSKFNELQPKLDAIDDKFTKQNGQFNEVKTELTKVKSELEHLSTRVTEAVDLLKTMSGKQ